jgi:hypothetical protein
MDEELPKRLDRIEDEILARSPPQHAGASETPYLVPRETVDGVRYVRSRTRRVASVRRLVSFCAGGLVVLTAACATAGILIANEAAGLAASQLYLAILYPFQLALDIAGFVRLTWPFFKWMGDVQLQLSTEQLRFGIRWGPIWMSREDIALDRLTRLVVVRRPAGKSDSVWDLLAERSDALPATLISADDPGNVLPLAKDLNDRLTRTLGIRWPNLAEESRPVEDLSPLPPRRALLPGGAASWLIVHFAGSVGLWQTLKLAWFQQPRPPWHTVVLALLVLLQGLILLGNAALFGAERSSSAK